MLQISRVVFCKIADYLPQFYLMSLSHTCRKFRGWTKEYIKQLDLDYKTAFKSAAILSLKSLCLTQWKINRPQDARTLYFLKKKGYKDQVLNHAAIKFKVKDYHISEHNALQYAARFNDLELIKSLKNKSNESEIYCAVIEAFKRSDFSLAYQLLNNRPITTEIIDKVIRKHNWEVFIYLAPNFKENYLMDLCCSYGFDAGILYLFDKIPLTEKQEETICIDPRIKSKELLQRLKLAPEKAFDLALGCNDFICDFFKPFLDNQTTERIYSKYLFRTWDLQTNCNIIIYVLKNFKLKELHKIQNWIQSFPLSKRKKEALELVAEKIRNYD